MKITVVLLIFLVLFSPISPAQDYAQMSLPDGAVARLGKGMLRQVLYSPDGTRLVVLSLIGIWLYDTTVYRVENSSDSRPGETEDLPFRGSRRVGTDLSRESSPISSGQAKPDRNGEVALLAAHIGRVKSVAFSPDGGTLAGGSGDGTVLVWKIDYGERYK